MPTDSTVTRRSVLAAGAAGAGAVALAACSSSSSKKDDNSPAASQPASSGLAKLADIQVGMCVKATLPDGKAAIVSRPTGDTVAAFSAKCTHMGCTVAPAGGELHCPCHGSKFNALTGEVIHGPAASPLPKIDVHVANGEVVTS
jgi:Rieske Fe-S protein